MLKMKWSVKKDTIFGRNSQVACYGSTVQAEERGKISSQCSSFRSRVTWSNFLETQMIWAAKFWTTWSFSRLVSATLDQTEEQ